MSSTVLFFANSSFSRRDRSGFVRNSSVSSLTCFLSKASFSCSRFCKYDCRDRIRRSPIAASLAAASSARALRRAASLPSLVPERSSTSFFVFSASFLLRRLANSSRSSISLRLWSSSSSRSSSASFLFPDPFLLCEPIVDIPLLLPRHAMGMITRVE